MFMKKHHGLGVTQMVCTKLFLYNLYNLGILNSLLCQVDPTFRSLLEETSVDYIHKFRDLASQMNTDH